MSFNIDESSKSTPQERGAEDLESLRELIVKVLNTDSTIEITEPIRLGKRRIRETEKGSDGASQSKYAPCALKLLLLRVKILY